MNLWPEQTSLGAEGDDREEQQRQQASSPPPSWEDRAELMPEEHALGVSWMETGTHACCVTQQPYTLWHLGQHSCHVRIEVRVSWSCVKLGMSERSHNIADEAGDRSGEAGSPPAQTASSSQGAGSSTPDLLADTPPPPQRSAEPNDDRLDLAASRPQRLFRGACSPRGGSPARSPGRSPPSPGSTPGPSGALGRPAGAAKAPPGAPAAQQPESSAAGAGPKPGPAALRLSGGQAEGGSRSPDRKRALSPQGCYSTIAAHELAPQEASLGHELPSCFGAADPHIRVSSPPMGAHSTPPHEDGAGEAASDDSEREGSSFQKVDAGAPARAVGGSTAAEKGRGGSQPLSGLRDLLAPVGGLFKGAFGASSSEGPAANPGSQASPDSNRSTHDSNTPQSSMQEHDRMDTGGKADSSLPEQAPTEQELSEDTLAHCPEIDADLGPRPDTLESHFTAAEGSRTSLEERTQQAKEDLMEISHSQNADLQHTAVHTGSFAASMASQQAEGSGGPPAETTLAPYVPLMATDAVADAAAALILDDVVPVQEENVIVVESTSSNAGGWLCQSWCPHCVSMLKVRGLPHPIAAGGYVLGDSDRSSSSAESCHTLRGACCAGMVFATLKELEHNSSHTGIQGPCCTGMPVAELLEGEDDSSDRDSQASARTSSGESLGALEAIAEAQHAADTGTDSLGMPLLSAQAEDSAPIGVPLILLSQSCPPSRPFCLSAA